MDAFGIADIYRAAKIPLSSDLLKLRQEPFDALRSKLSLQQSIDLARLYFGSKEKLSGDWFFAAFHRADNTFSLHENAREAAVLAASILAAAVSAKKQTCSLAPLASGFAGIRKPLVVPELRALFEKRLTDAAVSEKEAEIEVAAIKAPTIGKASADALTLPQNADWNRAATLIKQVADEAHAATTSVANGTVAAVEEMSSRISSLREETDMLWWYVGGVSRKTNEPFVDMFAGSAAIMAGIDLADLARNLIGPYAGPALLQRLIQAGRKGKAQPVTLREAIDGVSVDGLSDITSSVKLVDLPETLPVLYAIKKQQENGSEGAWVSGFEKAAWVKADQKILPIDLAIQAYRERQLLAGLG